MITVLRCRLNGCRNGPHCYNVQINPLHAFDTGRRECVLDLGFEPEKAAKLKEHSRKIIEQEQMTVCLREPSSPHGKPLR